MQVGPLIIALPDFHQAVSQRLTVYSQDSSGHMRNGAHCGIDILRNDQEIVVCIERQLVRIKRTFRRSRRLRKFLGQETGRIRHRRKPCGLTQKCSTIRHHSTPISQRISFENQSPFRLAAIHTLQQTPWICECTRQNPNFPRFVGTSVASVHLQAKAR